jgi:hypothetical protein
MHHPEQPALTRVLDVQIRGEAAGRVDQCVSGITHLCVDIVGLSFVVEEVFEDT